MRLAKRVHAGDNEARQQMIHANLRLVVKIALDYEGLGLPLPDLINESNIVLMKAVERFDPKREINFRPTVRVGSNRESSVPWPIRAKPFACRFTWLKKSRG